MPARPVRTAAVDEFRDLVKALHRAGIEVILDVVYNHTAEVGADGPTFSFRGLANDDYYILDGAGGFIDDSGTGNTFNANRPIVRRLIVDSLRYWVQEMHVDGFRFDLAAVLSRDEAGQPMADPPALWDIETDPVLAGTKLIAEAWDAGGLYQVGSFVGERWVEWNGRFRDDVRSFVKGDRDTVPAIMQRFLGSPDIYGHKRREPQASVNFVTCHDGFTLNDLVSYDAKHNESNGEGNRDGNDQNLSWNCGVEGPTDDPAIEALRARQIRNFLAIDLLALGAPMLLMGDEVRRTQGGNNNAYGHDDPLSWFDWTAVDRQADLLRFTRGLIRLRRQVTDVLALPDDISLLDLLAEASIEWDGVALGEPDLGPDSHSVALTVRVDQGAMRFVFNAYWEPLEFALPVPDASTMAGAGSSTPASNRPTTSPSTGTRRRRSVDRPTASRLVRSSSWRRAGRQAPLQAGGRTDGRRTQADGERRPSRERLARGQSVVRVGAVSRRAGVGRRARGLLGRRRRVELVPARPCALAGVPLERGRDGGDDRRLQPAVARAHAVERPGPDPQGADVRTGRPRGQPRRGRQGILVVPRRRPEQRLAALALPLPAGCLPVRRPDRDQPRAVQARARVRADRHRHLRRRPLLDRRGPLRQGDARPTS